MTTFQMVYNPGYIVYGIGLLLIAGLIFFHLYQERVDAWLAPLGNLFAGAITWILRLLLFVPFILWGLCVLYVLRGLVQFLIRP